MACVVRAALLQSATVTVPEAFALAVQHHRAGRLAEAEAIYRQILAVDPRHPGALHLLGVVAHQVGRNDVAVEMILQAIALAPIIPEFHSNLGEAYRTLGRLDEAIAAYRRAIELKPDYAEAHSNLGFVLKDQSRIDEAIAACRCALALNPDFPEAHNNLGNALEAQGQLDEALAAYRRGLQLKPDFAEAHSNLIYALHFHPGCDERTIAAEHQRWNRQFADPLKRLVLPHSNDRSPERRLRIGYVSPDFREHVVGRNLIPLFQCHDSREVEILCYSGLLRPDRLTEEFRRRAHQWRDTAAMTDAALAEMIQRDGVDILVDLTQHLAGNRLPLFARKPAPVQVSFAGYPASAGLEAIEYRLSDRYLESGCAAAAPGSRERVFLLDSFWCFDASGIEVEVNALPATKRGVVTFGCLNNFCKVNEPVLLLWARVLGRVSGSRLVILSPLGSHRQRTLEILGTKGVEPHRVEFVEPRARKAYLELYHRLDIFLDTFPYDGHTTSLDALSMGVPVVSLAGPLAVSRAGLSQLSNLGLPELVAHSEDDYVKIAAELAGDIPRLSGLRGTLRERMKASVLMDAPRFARQIEDAYRQMWRAWCARQCSTSPS